MKDFLVLCSRDGERERQRKREKIGVKWMLVNERKSTYVFE